MKKQLLILCLFIASSTAWSQVDLKIPTMGEILSEGKTNHQFSNEIQTNQIQKDLGITIWSDDFSDSSTWTIDNSGESGIDYGWNINSISEGWWSTAGINSTSGGNYAELVNGDPFAATQALDVIYNLTTVNPIDVIALGGTNQVTLQFEQYGARFNDLQEISISTDGVIFTPIGNNLDQSVLSASGGSAYSNPDIKQINLGTILSPTNAPIWIRFSWTTNYPGSASNPNVWVTYGWYIDDVKLATNPTNDLETTDSYWGTEGLNYYQIPLTQAAPIDFSATVFNAGTNTQDNVALNVEVNGALFSGTSAGVSLNSLDTTTLDLTTQFTPATISNYTATRTISMDSIDDNPSNNELSNISFNVTEYIYARDNNNVSGSTSNGADGFEVGNLYDIWQDQTVESINIRMPSGSSGATVGTEIFVKLYEIDPNATGGLANALIYVEESDPIILENNMLNTNLVVPLLAPADVYANTTYLAIAGSFTEGLRVSNAGSSYPQTSFFQDYSDGTWYYQTSTPYVRLNFESTAGLEENSQLVQVGSIYPNPVTEEASIRFNVKNTSDFNVHVSDMTGRTVYSKSITLVNGLHNFVIDTGDYGIGIYNVHVTDGMSSVSRKFVKQ